jgi:hypothetical protein
MQSPTTLPTVGKLVGYCIKHTDEYLFFRDNSGEHITDDFDLAATYPSKLAAVQQCGEYFKRAEVNDDTTWQIVRRSAVVIKPKPLEAPFELHITDPFEAVHKIYDLHCEYSRRVSSWLVKAGVQNIPQQAECRITITAPHWAGIWSPRGRVIHYPAVYCMMAGDFHKIIAHEVVHSYQDAFCGRGSGHGNDFYALMKHAALEPVNRHTHNYSVNEAQRLSKVLRRWWQEQSQRGLITSLPVDVDTSPMKRKGFRD